MRGKKLKVKVTGTKKGFKKASATSRATKVRSDRRVARLTHRAVPAVGGRP